MKMNQTCLENPSLVDGKPRPRLVRGFCWIFENVNVFGVDEWDVLSLCRGIRSRRKLGKYLGVVIEEIPYDGIYVLYEYRRDTPQFQRRQAERRILAKIGLSRRKMQVMKKWRGQRKIDQRWL